MMTCLPASSAASAMAICRLWGTQILTACMSGRPRAASRSVVASAASHWCPRAAATAALLSTTASTRARCGRRRYAAACRSPAHPAPMNRYPNCSARRFHASHSPAPRSTGPVHTPPVYTDRNGARTQLLPGPSDALLRRSRGMIAARKARVARAGMCGRGGEIAGTTQQIRCAIYIIPRRRWWRGKTGGSPRTLSSVHTRQACSMRCR